MVKVEKMSIISNKRGKNIKNLSAKGKGNLIT